MEPSVSAFSEAPVVAPGLTARIAERWRLWRHRRRWISEMRDAAALGRLDDLLQDVGMTRGELDLLIEVPLDAGQQFETLAEMEKVELSAIPPDELREAHWNCVRCDCREPCKRWLATGVWEHEGDSRCPNADLLNGQ